MRRGTSAFLLTLVLSPTLFAQQVDVPLRNWTVPPYTAASAGGGLRTMTDATRPQAFVAVEPCRVVDTRGNGFTANYGPPALSSFATRVFLITGSPTGVPPPPAGCPAGTIPSGAAAVSLQFTIVTPSSSGNLIAWESGAIPNVSVLNWDPGTVALGNATVVPLTPGGMFSVRLNTATVGQTAHLVVDVNGYYSETPSDPAGRLVLEYNSDFAALDIRNSSHNCFAGCAIAAVTESGDAVFAYSTSGGVTRGLSAGTASTGSNAAGVRGFYGSLVSIPVPPTYAPTGVRGEGSSTGVLGLSNFQGVAGSLVSGTSELAYGILGFDSGAVNYGVWYFGGLGGTGSKISADPHPTDPSKVIRYISLEGNEPGTYFRGKGRFQRGMARIPVPEDFRMVTDEEGLTVQVTPIGGMASVGVMKADLNEIVVRSSRNLEFYYMVNGIRRTQKHLTSPIGEGSEFMPRSAEAKMPEYLTDGQKELLIQNGTYRADGTVNRETARRLGWDRVWADRERPSSPPSE
jgi:hypothetical protein